MAIRCFAGCQVAYMNSHSMLNLGMVLKIKKMIDMCLFPLCIGITEVQSIVKMKNGIFWDVTPCGSCKNRRFGGT
jgi:hypothetical protein